MDPTEQWKCHVFIGDDAFPLQPNMMKPFKGEQEMVSQEFTIIRFADQEGLLKMLFGMSILCTTKPMMLNPHKAINYYLHTPTQFPQE